MRPYPPLLALILAFPGLAISAPPTQLDDVTLRAVRFVDSQEGWASGDQGVIWHTIDSGKTWERQVSGTRASLRAMQFLTPYVGFVVGRTELPEGAGSHGIVLSTIDGGATWREMTSTLLPGLRDVHFLDENHGFVAGDASAAFPTIWFETTDGGKSWRPKSLTPGQQEISQPARLQPDFHRQCRIDPDRVWVVGDFGTIRGSQDGGKTWTVLKCGAQRAAVLFLHARPESVPLGAIAQLAREGYLVVAWTSQATDEPRLSAAMRLCGGATGVASTATTPDELRAEMVAAIRRFQPDVIVSDLLSPSASPREQAVLLAAKEAFELAADAKLFPTQLDAGLKPHAAKKFYALAPTSGEANVSLDLLKFVPEFGEATRDWVEPATGLLGAPNPDSARFRLVSHRLPGSETQTSLMAGIPLAEGGTARRTAMMPVADVALAEKQIQLRRRIEETMRNPTAVGGLVPAVGQVLHGLSGMPDDLAARTAVGLGRQLAAQGQWTTARELFMVVVEKYSAQPSAIEAIRWLVTYQASGEVRRRIELGHFPVYQRSAFAAVEPKAIQTVSHTEEFLAKPQFQFTSPAALKQWHQACIDLEPKLVAFGAAYARDPGLNLATLSARRQLGLNLHASEQLRGMLSVGEPQNPWQKRLADEQRLLTAARPQHSPVAVCWKTAVRPMLDGRFEDDCWKAAPAMESTTPSGLTTRTQFAYDEKFLYLAVTCQNPEGKQVPRIEKRGRDADLAGFDRVELVLDQDRDYQSAYRLRVDQRGAVAEDCWGDTSWNPRWFVAHESTATGWTVEAAIPWVELTGTVPTPGQTWAANLIRVVPGVGGGSWSGPASETPILSEMGLLQFGK